MEQIANVSFHEALQALFSSSRHTKKQGYDIKTCAHQSVQFTVIEWMLHCEQHLMSLCEPSLIGDQGEAKQSTHAKNYNTGKDNTGKV